MRKLPVYLLLDTSGSMYGEPMEAVKNGLETLVATLQQDPYALETAHLSVITFANEARQISPLTDITSFQMPALEARGQTSLGAALELLAGRVDEEVTKTTPEKKGDWKPLVFIMTDGAPTDRIDAGIEALKSRQFGMVVACAAGEKANVPVLKLITDDVARLDSMDSDAIRAFFKWVSASVSAGSQKVDGGQDVSARDELPPPPEEISFV
ncbi:MAG: VWA domain-containing protein [Desulfovibrio sp.]|nr:VWA domain-containing protein [Desulfovibrio sp.]